MSKVRAISKADLCRIFGLCSLVSDRIYYSKLKKDYFDKEALREIGITEEQYDAVVGGRPFTASQTKRIIKYFDISAEELTLF